MVPSPWKKSVRSGTELARSSDPVYMDTSALVKLVVPEPESDALITYLNAYESQMTTSQIAEIELARIVNRIDDATIDEVARLLNHQVLLPMTGPIRVRAASLQPLGIGSLDAVHLATAVEFQPHLGSFICYDNRIIEAAESLDLNVVSPT